MSATTTTLAELPSLKGTELGTSDWVEVTQERVNLFADATGDHQWIHVDVERANAESPFGGPIAHGYLTLALSNLFLPELLAVPGASAGVNYGTGKVRFPSPVPVDSRLRSHVRFGEVRDLAAGKQLVVEHTVEIEGHDKPACVAAHVVLLLA